MNNNYHVHLRNRFSLHYDSVQLEIVNVIPSSKHVYTVKVLKADLIDNEYNDHYLLLFQYFNMSSRGESMPRR
jgi:hypothetical protein